MKRKKHAKIKCRKCKDTGLLYVFSKKIRRKIVAGICDCRAGYDVMQYVPFRPIPLDLLIIKFGNRSFRIRLEPM
jgi:hypothetical protein